MKTFSKATLAKFEDASAGIPLRQLLRCFDAVGIRPSDDPGGVDGARKVQFRRYVAGVDQRDTKQLAQLAGALGAMVGEVATSKIAFLVSAAESDGFSFTDGVFQATQFSASSFAITSADQFASIDERAKRLDVLAASRPQDAIAGAIVLVESTCRTVLRDRKKPAPKSGASLATIVSSTLRALAVDVDAGALVASIVSVSAMRSASPAYAKLAVGAARTLATFLADVSATPCVSR